MDLVKHRTKKVHNLQQFDTILMKGFSVWMGLTFELMLHTIIELLDQLVLASMQQNEQNDNTTTLSGRHRRSLGSTSSDDSDPTTLTASQQYAIKFALEFAFALVLSALVVGIT